MITTFYETLLAMPHRLHNDPYGQHQYVKDCLDLRKANHIPLQFFSMLPAAPMMQIRSPEPISSESKKTSLDLTVGRRVEMVGRVCMLRFYHYKEDGKQHEGHRHVSTEALGGWINRRILAQSGINGYAKPISAMEKPTFRKPGLSNVFIPYVDVLISGTLADPELFSKLMANGIGKKRSFGMGMFIEVAQ